MNRRTGAETAQTVIRGRKPEITPNAERAAALRAQADARRSAERAAEIERAEAERARLAGKLAEREPAIESLEAEIARQGGSPILSRVLAGVRLEVSAWRREIDRIDAQLRILRCQPSRVIPR